MCNLIYSDMQELLDEDAIQIFLQASFLSWTLHMKLGAH